MHACTNILQHAWHLLLHGLEINIYYDKKYVFNVRVIFLVYIFNCVVHTVLNPHICYVYTIRHLPLAFSCLVYMTQGWAKYLGLILNITPLLISHNDLIVYVWIENIIIQRQPEWVPFQGKFKPIN